MRGPRIQGVALNPRLCELLKNHTLMDQQQQQQPSHQQQQLQHQQQKLQQQHQQQHQQSHQQHQQQQQQLQLSLIHQQQHNLSGSQRLSPRNASNLLHNQQQHKYAKDFSYASLYNVDRGDMGGTAGIIGNSGTLGVAGLPLHNVRPVEPVQYQKKTLPIIGLRGNNSKNSGPRRKWRNLAAASCGFQDDYNLDMLCMRQDYSYDDIC